MSFVINNQIIEEPILAILLQVKKELNNGKLSRIVDKGDWISIPCPFHSNGMEKHNSCGVVVSSDEGIEEGTFNCLACKEHGSLAYLIGACFDRNESFGTKWLLDHYGNTFLETQYLLPSIDLKKEVNKTKYIDETVLDSYQSYHPYMTKRKLNEYVINKFKIKYNPEQKTLVFPVWDEYNNLVMLTQRKVEYKDFFVPKGVDKPVYLLNYAIKDKSPYVIVVESQINALTLQKFNLPAVALFGCAISKYQVEQLKKSGIRHFVLSLDPDEAGRSGEERFRKMMGDNIFIDYVHIPKGKDINDLTDDEIKYYFKSYLTNKENSDNIELYKMKGENYGSI